MRKQDPETCDFPKSCGKLKMKIMTMSPYRAFLTKACPLLLWEMSLFFFFFYPHSFFFFFYFHSSLVFQTWYHKPLWCTAFSRLLVSHPTSQPGSRRILHSLGPCFCRGGDNGVDVGRHRAETPPKRSLLLAWFPLGSAEGEISLYKSDPLSGTKHQQQTKTRPKSIHLKRQSGAKAENQRIGPWPELIARISLQWKGTKKKKSQS